jgi:hypothetical protein
MPASLSVYEYTFALSYLVNVDEIQKALQNNMSKTQILEELPKLSASDRSQLFARLAELYEADLLDGGSPSPSERQALDEALAEFERDPSSGEPWRDVFSQIRKSRR